MACSLNHTPRWLACGYHKYIKLIDAKTTENPGIHILCYSSNK